MDSMMYVQFGLTVILFIGIIILFVIMMNMNSSLTKRVDELTSSTKSDLTNATSELRKKTTFFDHPEFANLDPKIKELLVMNISYGFLPKFMEAVSSFVTRENYMGALTDKLTSLNAMSKEEILAKFSILQPTSNVVEGFGDFTKFNYFRNFFE